MQENFDWYNKFGLRSGQYSSFFLFPLKLSILIPKGTIFLYSEITLLFKYKYVRFISCGIS